MEDELFLLLYTLILEEAKRRPRPKRVQLSDGGILTVAFWAILHDRPMCWACQRRHWPLSWQWLRLPSPATLSRRLRTLSVQLLLEQLFHRVLAAGGPEALCLSRRLDSKPLIVGGFSKDRDARRGYAVGGKCRGYKLFACWGKSPVAPETLVLGPMNQSDQAGAMQLIDRLQALYGQVGGYVLADATHDTNPLHEHAGRCGLQLLTPRKAPKTGLGKRPHSPYRLRSIELLEGPADPLLLATGGTACRFGPELYRHRGQVERDLGNMCSFGGGLQPLPQWVRRPHRVALWVIGKLVINGLRICRKQGLTP